MLSGGSDLSMSYLTVLTQEVPTDITPTDRLVSVRQIGAEELGWFVFGSQMEYFCNGHMIHGIVLIGRMCLLTACTCDCQVFRGCETIMTHEMETWQQVGIRTSVLERSATHRTYRE